MKALLLCHFYFFTSDLISGNASNIATTAASLMRISHVGVKINVFILSRDIKETSNFVSGSLSTLVTIVPSLMRIVEVKIKIFYLSRDIT